MKFGPVPLAMAAGAVLAHSLRLDGRVLKKGLRLGPRDLATLEAAGIETVTVARFEDGDVPEDDAARRIAVALAPVPDAAGLSLSAPFTGRANLYAAEAGVLSVDTDAVAALNAIDESMTLACLSDQSRVAARQMIATVKIIPYSAPEAKIRAAEQRIAAAGVLKVHPFRMRSADIILTRTPGMKDSVLRKGQAVVEARLRAIGVDDMRTVTVAHETEAVAGALTACTGDAALILTGSATLDRLDVGPSALVAAGGALTRFGMPVDPGNLLFIGALSDRPVIGLPGCARSPKLNGADWVLERIAAGLAVTSEDIAAMGVGGLLKEIPSRPEPRGGGAEAPRRPVIAAVVLAAGASLRMQGRDKLLEEIDGEPVLARIVAGLEASGVDQIHCVLRPEDTAREAALAGRALSFVPNPRAAEGMGTSIAAGIAALDRHVDAALLVLADMPEIGADEIDRVLAAFDPGENRAIVRATGPDGQPGHPVLFGRRFFESMRALEGDQGARAILAEHGDFVVDVPLSGGAAVTDLDTPEAWARWRAGR